ncbi:MAG: AAA family ATPase, partial [Deltaproteobacteria bacterium]|nr:AAA family ATPase [Deltaproteobacteria bacterium]
MPRVMPLPPSELSWKCDDGVFSFATTEELPSLKEMVGQERALKSLEFGLGVVNHNYNIFVLGESGTGKNTTVRELVEKKARTEP